MNKRLFDLLSENITSVTIILLATIAIVWDFVGFSSGDTTQLIILIVLGLLAVEWLSLKRGLTARLDLLNEQMVGGNPNAVFKISGEVPTIANLISQARENIFLSGYSYVGILSTESHTIIQSLNKGVNVRVILPDPSDSSLIQYLALGLKKASETKTIKNDIEYSLAQLIKISELAQGTTGSLDVRLTRVPLTTLGLLVDNETLLMSLLYAGTGGITQSTYFKIDKYASSELFKNFSTSLENTWENATKYSPSLGTGGDNAS
jgi:hypothetical protein